MWKEVTVCTEKWRNIKF